jgi:hypothetical protein
VADFLTAVLNEEMRVSVARMAPTPYSCSTEVIRFGSEIRRAA